MSLTRALPRASLARRTLVVAAAARGKHTLPDLPYAYEVSMPAKWVFCRPYADACPLCPP